jgi:hypothetical protein
MEMSGGGYKDGSAVVCKGAETPRGFQKSSGVFFFFRFEVLRRLHALRSTMFVGDE